MKTPEPRESAKLEKNQPRKPYQAPRLTSYGDFQQLTQGVGGTKNDGGGHHTKA